jgi:hypothetical protein
MHKKLKCQKHIFSHRVFVYCVQYCLMWQRRFCWISYLSCVNLMSRPTIWNLCISLINKPVRILEQSASCLCLDAAEIQTFQWHSMRVLRTINPMEQSLSLEADSRSVSQKIPRYLWNRKVLYFGHNSLPPTTILSQMNLVHIPKSYFSKIHFNIILPSTPTSSEWSLLLRFSPCLLHAPPLPSSLMLSP